MKQDDCLNLFLTAVIFRIPFSVFLYSLLAPGLRSLLGELSEQKFLWTMFSFP